MFTLTVPYITVVANGFQPIHVQNVTKSGSLFVGACGVAWGNKCIVHRVWPVTAQDPYGTRNLCEPDVRNQ